MKVPGWIVMVLVSFALLALSKGHEDHEEGAGLAMRKTFEDKRRRITNLRKRRKLRKEGELKFCGSESIVPLKNLVCHDFCEGGQCQNFFCQCRTSDLKRDLCEKTGNKSRCAVFCSRYRFSSAFHCAKTGYKSQDNYHCVCA